MKLEEMLCSAGVITRQQTKQAQELADTQGGRPVDHLVTLGYLSQERLATVEQSVPAAPKSVAESEVSEAELLNLLLKIMLTRALETPGRLSEAIKLPMGLTGALLQTAVDRKLVEILGRGSGDSALELRHQLSALGRERAAAALEINQYNGPAPVSLEAYSSRIERQRIIQERVSRDRIDVAFDDLVVEDSFIHRLGPAVNSGRAILLYGPAGNGKTTVAEKVAAIFSDIVYIPYALEVQGQIIKIFDPSLHESVEADEDNLGRSVLKKAGHDRRWVACKRPVVITGGELNLEMLDLTYSVEAGFYEAPLHMKAFNGTFIIDDFGRQLISPERLLNRWIVPLQSRVDYLKLHTGKAFQVPFDELVIFSTNLDPKDLMDPAFLRRIPYKLATPGPSEDAFRAIFEHVAGKEGMTLPDEVHRFVVDELTVRRGVELACYQPKFIVDQVVAACKFDGREAAMDSDTVAQAISNLYVGLDGAQEGAAARQNRVPDGQAKAPADDVWNEARQQLRS